MSAGIVYQGVVPQDGGGGTLFSDMKFWVAQRVPDRKAFTQKIESNGGKVVRLEKDAHHLIADHTRGDAPPGSLSWKFIEDSLASGALQLPENYQNSPSDPPARPVGSNLPPKRTRTAFTPEEDRILAAWVIKQGKLGHAQSGDIIYKKLEAEHPRHTWQSWKNRWKQKVSLYDRPSELPDISDRELTPPAPPGPPAPAPTTIRKPDAGNAPVAGRRNMFTHDEDMWLLQYIVDCQKDNKKHLSGNIIFEELARDLPQHTAQSWRDRWVRILKPKIASGKLVYDGLSPTWPGTRASNTSQSPQQARGQGTPQEAPALEEHQEDVEKDNVDDELQQQTAPSPTRAPTSPIRNQEVQEDSLPDGRPQTPYSPKGGPSIEDESEVSPFAEAIDLKTQFNKDYQEFARIRDIQPYWFLTVQHKSFELWDLWQAVESQKVEPKERDWEQISEQLGFNWVKYETAPNDLRVCYERNLSEFEALLKSFDEQSGEDEDETQPTHQAHLPGEMPLPSSPPTLSTLKRSYDVAIDPSCTYPHSSPKRPRLDPSSEVPSTPDEKNGTSHLRYETIAGPGLTETVSPNLGSCEAALLPPARKRVEPETQNFRFDPETQAIVFESQENVTPSQQLLLESDARSDDPAFATPTPVRTRPARGPFLDESDERSTRASKSKRRSLPGSYTQPPSTAAYRTSPSARQQTTSASTLSAAQLRPTVQTRETAEDIIEFYISLGYNRDDVICALDATTWVPGLASQVMEKLKSGEDLPSSWRGVWTEKDDRYLRTILADHEPRDAKERRRREKQRDWLNYKHSNEGVEMRVRFLETQDKGGRVRLAQDRDET